NGPAGQPSTVAGEIRNQTFSYDVLGRIAAASGEGSSSGAWQRRYAYDRWGNRIASWDSAAGGNQIQGIALQHQAGAPAGVTSNKIQTATQGQSTLSITYDAAGNMINDGNHSFQYDAAGRMTRVDSGSANESVYSYDSNNWRVK